MSVLQDVEVQLEEELVELQVIFPLSKRLRDGFDVVKDKNRTSATKRPLQVLKRFMVCCPRVSKPRGRTNLVSEGKPG